MQIDKKKPNKNMIQIGLSTCSGCQFEWNLNHAKQLCHADQAASRRTADCILPDNTQATRNSADTDHLLTDQFLYKPIPESTTL